MDAYLTKEGQGFSILYNKSKTLEEKVEPAEESRVQRFAKHFPLYNLTMFTARWSEKVIQESIGVKLASDSRELVVHYAHIRNESEAKEAFNKIVKKEIRRSNIAALVCLFLIPATLPTPMPGTTFIFGSAVYQSIRIRQAIKQCAKKAVFRPNEKVTGLESKILEGGGKSAEDCFAEYDFT
ncbi:MAG: hypothetical protein KJ955_00495 [Nanoarchaeota archaeon]|nr:hypothetical protein [Nanoarchaeota archaeon]